MLCGNMSVACMDKNYEIFLTVEYVIKISLFAKITEFRNVDSNTFIIKKKLFVETSESKILYLFQLQAILFNPNGP